MRLLQEKLVKRALRGVSLDLYLERRWSRWSGDYYCVCISYREADEPFVVCDWRQRMEAIPLSVSLVDRVRWQEGDLEADLRHSMNYNKARKEQLRQERHLQQDEVSEEWQRSGRATGIPQDSSITVSKQI